MCDYEGIFVWRASKVQEIDKITIQIIVWTSPPLDCVCVCVWGGAALQVGLGPLGVG